MIQATTGRGHGRQELSQLVPRRQRTATVNECKHSCPAAPRTATMTLTLVSATSAGTGQVIRPSAARLMPGGPDSSRYDTPPRFDFTTSGYAYACPLTASGGGWERTSR